MWENDGRPKQRQRKGLKTMRELMRGQAVGKISDNKNLQHCRDSKKVLIRNN